MTQNNTRRALTAEDLYRFQWCSGARIAPDGQSVVYSVHRIDAKTEKKYANLWVAAIAPDSPPRAFTYGDQTDMAARWSPDGKTIAFLSNRADAEKPAGLYLLPFGGGEARPLTHFEGSLGAPVWSPDGQHLLCTLRKTDADVLEREKDPQRKKLGTVARQYDRLFYKLDGYGYLPKERQHLALVDIATGAVTPITEGDVHDEDFPTWAPDGQSIAFLSNRSPDPDAVPDRIDVFVLPLRGGTPGEMRRIETPVGQKMHLSFSPDGRWLAYFGQEGEGLSYKNTNLWIVPTDGGQAARSLTAPYDLDATGWTINDIGEQEAMAPLWSLDGKTIYFQAAYHGSGLLESVSVESGERHTILGEGGVVFNFSMDRAQTHISYAYGRMQDPGQIFVRDLTSGGDRQCTQLNQDLLDEWDLGSVETVWFKGPDGNDLQGWLLKPPGFNPTRKYPAIIEIHGGPLTQYGHFFMHEFYYLAAAGYVVCFSNPRGGRGYGEEHAKAIWGDWGNKDYADLMTWADTVAALPYVDTTRMGVTGGSYGGYMTVWIIGHTNRFRAAVTQRCVSNFVSMWGSSDFNWTFQTELNNKMPFEDLQYYWDHSPIAFIGSAKTPTLVIHNENDLRCPIEQGEQVFVALKRLNVPSAFVRFPDEFHGLSRNGRTDRRIVRLNAIRDWFDRYMKD